MKKTFDISNTSNSIKAKKNPILLILVIMIKINKQTYLSKTMSYDQSKMNRQLKKKIQLAL